MFKILKDVYGYDENGNGTEPGLKLINTDNITYIEETLVEVTVDDPDREITEEELNNMEPEITTVIHMTDGTSLYIEATLEDVSKILCGAKI